MPCATCCAGTLNGHNDLIVVFLKGEESTPMNYTPHKSYIPYLKVPENRLNLAFTFYQQHPDHQLNFPCYSYWIQRCENDGSDY